MSRSTSDSYPLEPPPCGAVVVVDVVGVPAGLVLVDVGAVVGRVARAFVGVDVGAVGRVGAVLAGPVGRVWGRLDGFNGGVMVAGRPTASPRLGSLVRDEYTSSASVVRATVGRLSASRWPFSNASITQVTGAVTTSTATTDTTGPTRRER
ncbi:MAG: hypothetical protein ACRDP9_20295 [Kribbellaceae bacterium]|nr:hypothetical protein [Kribbellaceae bacterium]